MRYETGFKKSIVRKLLLPDSPGIKKISEEYGVTTTTLYSWLKKYKESALMTDGKRTPDEWSLVEKQEAIVEAAALDDTQLGEWLRRKGLKSEHLQLWPNEIRKALLASLSNQPKRELQQARQVIKKLEKEVRQKEKALAEVTAILALKKKLSILFGGEER